MAFIEITPEGRLEIGTVRDGDGRLWVQVELPDANGTHVVGLNFTLAGFVTVADHLRMAADTIVAEHFGNIDNPDAR